MTLTLAFLVPHLVYLLGYALLVIVDLVALLIVFGEHGWWIAAAGGIITLMCSCSTQVITRTDGTRIVNNNLISAGTLTVDPAGNVLMSGTSEKAGEYLAKHLRMSAMIGLAGQGVEAVKDMTTEAINQ